MLFYCTDLPSSHLHEFKWFFSYCQVTRLIHVSISPLIMSLSRFFICTDSWRSIFWTACFLALWMTDPQRDWYMGLAPKFFYILSQGIACVQTLCPRASKGVRAGYPRNGSFHIQRGPGNVQKDRAILFWSFKIAGIWIFTYLYCRWLQIEKGLNLRTPFYNVERIIIKILWS